MSHTPGPWELVEREERDGICVDIVARGKDFGGRDLVIASDVCSPARHYGESVRTANARVMVIAPDLLAALKATVDCFYISKTAEEFVSSFQNNFLREAESAIAKAEGK